MNSNPENTTPADNPLLFLILEVPGQPQFHLAFPENNLIATELLSRLVDLKLEAAGQMTMAAKYGGPLNSSATIFCVREIQESMRLVCEVLEQTSLAPFAEIYCFDPREIMYRRIFPASTNGILPAELLAKFEAIAAGLKFTDNQLAKFLNPPTKDEASNPS